MSKLRFLFIIFLVLLSIPGIRYYQLNQERDLFLKASEIRSTATKLNIHPRKKIFDRNGIELATDILRPTLLFKNEKEKELALTVLLDDSQDIFLNTKRRLYLENKVSKKIFTKVQAACSCSPIREDTFKRYYPFGSIFGPVIGFSGTDGGLEGVEKVMNDLLVIDSERSTYNKSLRGEKLYGSLDSYLNLNSSEGLSLTLDTNLQFKLFDELKTAISDSKAKGGSAIIMDASSGDVLAMVSYPSFNPNNPQRVIERNRAIEDFYEPGSLIKPITVAGAIRLDLIKKNSIIDTNPGFITLSDIKRSEAGGKNFGNISLSEAISKSSQVGIAKISIKFSSDQIRENLRLFGFGEYLNINWLSNNSGIMIDAAKLYDIDKASLGYGYGLTSNSLQIARAYSAFANEGVMIEPKLYLEDEIIRKRVLTKSNADFILDSLRMTVLDGTASNLKDEEVEIAGKTGTSEKYIEGVGYATEKYISSFASIFPVQTPKYIMIVSIDEPDPNKYFGGDVSAPVVARISKYMKRLNYL